LLRFTCRSLSRDGVLSRLYELFCATSASAVVMMTVR